MSAVFIGVLCAGSGLYADDWAGFQHDVQHSGDAMVVFPNKEIKPLWTFAPTQKVWNYKKGSNVWSSSACIADVNGRAMVFAGLYNNNLYAIDAVSGNIAWRFIAGNSINSAPFFSVVNSRPTVYFASGDRAIYALDASTGEKIWSYETLEWNYAVSEAIVSSPVVISVDGRPALACGVWNNSQEPQNSFQRGEFFVLDAAGGHKIYSKVLSSTPLNSPAFAYINNKPVVFMSSRDGNVFAIDASKGETIWKITSCGELYSSPSVYVNGDKGISRLFIGSRFGNLYCLDAQTGKIVWTAKVGHAIDSTPAITTINDRVIIYAGSYDRNIYAFDADTGKEVWRFRTEDYISSSCAIARMGNETIVFVHSLDNKLYCLNGENGSLIWKVVLGKLIWGYNTRGDTIWSSPAVGTAGDKSILIFPCYDSKLYAFYAG